MATAIQRRRGTTTQHSSFTGLAGEITIDTDLNTIIVHDGSTAGGIRLAKYSEVQAAATGDITAITAGSGLTGGASSGAATVNIGSGTGITVNADSIEIDTSVVTTLTGSQTLTNKTLTSPVLNTGVSGTAILDEDNMASDSATQLATQQSIKAYVDSQVTAQDLDFQADSGGALSIDLDSEALTLTGGTGIDTAGSGNAVTFSLDLNELSAATVDVAADSIAIIDAGDNSSKKESIADLVSAIAGSGLNATDGVLAISETGDISAVTAGNGLSGGGSSGAVSLALDTSSATFTTGVQSFLGAGSLAGHIIPSADNTYDLGSSSKMWRDVYVGPGSLYVNGQQVISDNSGTITISADSNQNVTLQTSGSGDIELNATGTGTINLQSSITVDSGQTLTGTGGLTMASNINLNSNHINNISDPAQAQDAATKAYVDGATWLTGGSGITNSSGTLTVDSTVVRTTGTQSIAGDKTFTGTTTISGALNSTGTSVEIADNLITLNADATGTPSDNVGIIVERGDSTNVQLRWNESDDKWQFTNNGADYKNLIALDSISVTDSGGDGSMSYNNSTGVITYTGPSTAEVAAHLSVTDAGGDGSLAYNDTTGAFTYTGPSASEVRAHLTASDGVTVSGGEFSADSTVVRTTGAQTIAGAKTFSNDAIFNGNLTVNGTQTILNTETLTVDDNLIVLNNNESGTPSADAGIEVERGTSTNVKLQWDESADVWQQTRDGSAFHTLYIESEIEAFFSANDAGGLGSFSYNNAGQFTYTGPSNSDITGLISVTDSGGDGSLSYNAGVITYTGPSAAEVRAHFTGGTGVDISSGTITFDGSELSTSTTDGDGDFFVVVDSSDASRKLTKGSINISGFNNDSGFTTNVGDITGVTAGTGLSGGGASGSVTLNVTGLTVSELAAGSLQTSGESFSNDDTSLMTSAAIEDKILSYGYTTAVGDITGVTAGTGLSGGGTSGTVTLTLDNSVVRGLFSAGGDLSYNSSTGQFSFTNDAGDIESVTAGTGLSGGGSSGAVSLAFDGSELPDMTDAVDGSADELLILDNGTSKRKLVSEITLSDFNNDAGFTTNVGDITGVTAGTGLTGGGSSGGVTLNVNTGAVSNGASTIPTGDQVHDFVTGQGYVTSSGVTSVEITTGAGLDGTGTITSTGTIALSLDLSELTDMTAAVNSSQDELILLDNGAERRKLISEIGLSAFSNDSGFTTNVGDITNVAVSGTGLSGGGSSGAVTITSNATSSNTASTIVARDGSGNFSAGVITATATAARYADLAEIYKADGNLEPGDVVCFGGDEEITACSIEGFHGVAGVVSTDPAYLMNAEADGVPVALTGRVPVKVSGPVSPGDLLVSSSLSGHAKADNNARAGTIIGKAIGSNEAGEGVIEVLVNMM